MTFIEVYSVDIYNPKQGSDRCSKIKKPLRLRGMKSFVEIFINLNL